MVFRSLVGALTVILLAVALFTFYNFAGSPTDENLFSDLPGHLAFCAPDSSLTGLWAPTLAEPKDRGRGILGSVQAGDLLVMVNMKSVSSLDRLRALVAATPSDSALTLLVLRPTSRTVSTIRANRALLAESLFVEIPKGALVISVAPGGASDRAGMRVGDIIVRINGQEFLGAQDADVLLRRAQSGHVIIYDVLRDLHPLPLPVTLARFGFPLSLLILSLSGLVFMGIGAFISMKQPDAFPARLLGVGYLLLGFAIAILGLRRDPDVTVFVLLRFIVLVLSLYFGIGLLWHASLLFPSEIKSAQRRRWFINIEYGLATLITGLTVYLGASGVVRGNAELPVLIALFLPLLLYGWITRLVMRRGMDATARERCRIMRYTGIGVGIIIVVLLTLLVVTGNLDQSGFIGIPLLLLPLSALYTIGRYRLLGMNLRVRRTIQYVLTSILWSIVVLSAGITILTYCLEIPLHLPEVTIHGLSIEVSDASVVGGKTNAMERLVFVGLGLLAWVGISKTRKIGQGGIDRYFDRTQYDYRLALAEFSAVVSTNLSMTGLGKGIVSKLVEQMKLRRAAVFFFKEERVCCCREAEGVKIGEWSSFCLDQETLIAMAAGKDNAPISGDQLPPQLRDEFRKYQFEHLIPVRSKDRLIAVLVLGEKLSEAPFTAEDIDFLGSVALQASVAIENAFLYEELAGQERLKQELEIARRIQLASLPQQTPSVPGLEIAGRSIPALEVGGDFYDYLPGKDGAVTVVVGDVSGKGTSAALYMSKLQGVLRSLNAFVDSPYELFVRANALLGQGMEKSSYVTALGAMFEPSTHTVRIARAGHLPLYRFNRAAKTFTRLVPKGLGLALDQTTKFAEELVEQTSPCDPADVFVLISDGITEAMDGAGEQFGEGRIEQLLHNNANASAEALRDALLDDVRAFAGAAAQHDDQTVVVVKVVR